MIRTDPFPRLRTCADPTFWRRLALRNASRIMCGVWVPSSASVLGSSSGSGSGCTCAQGVNSSRKTNNSTRGTPMEYTERSVVLGFPLGLHIPPRGGELQRAMSDPSGEVLNQIVSPRSPGEGKGEGDEARDAFPDSSFSGAQTYARAEVKSWRARAK